MIDYYIYQKNINFYKTFDSYAIISFTQLNSRVNYMTSFEKKYLKYKNKYLSIKNKIGGGVDEESSRDTKIGECRPSSLKLDCDFEIPRLNGKLFKWKIINTISSPSSAAKTVKGAELGAFGIIYVGKLLEYTETYKPIWHVGEPKPLEKSELIKEGKEAKIIKLNILDYWQVDNKDLGLYSSEKLDQIKNEICLQNIAATLGITPKIEDYWICESDDPTKLQAVIVMEKVGTIPFKGYLDKCREYLDLSYEDACKELGIIYNEENKERVDIANLTMIYNVYYGFIYSVILFMKLNYNYIIHGDSHLNNVMITLNEKNIISDVHIIDFGKSLNLRQMSINLKNNLNFNTERNHIMENVHLINIYNDFLMYDLDFMFSTNNAIGIIREMEVIVKNKLTEPEDLKIKLFKCIEEGGINSMFLYYTYSVIYDRIIEIKKTHFNKNRFEIKRTFNLFDKSIDNLLEEIQKKMKNDVVYFNKLSNQELMKLEQTQNVVETIEKNNDMINKLNVKLNTYINKYEDNGDAEFIKHMKAETITFRKRIINIPIIEQR